jgi:hypothetical protein
VLNTNKALFTVATKQRHDTGAEVYRRHASFRRLLTRCIIVACLLQGGESVAATPPAVSPNQDFSNPVLQIHAPASSGWYGAERSPVRIAFKKAGSSAHETLVAAVFLFHLPPFPNSDAFTEFVREGIIKDAPSDRFEILASNIQYSSERGYPCVRYYGLSMDRKARVSALHTEEMRLEIMALYCQHPTRPGLGFNVSYSRRGGEATEKIDADAAAFIDSVQVPRASQTP